MPTTLELILAGVLLLAGLWLSAFFSGSETGFYRVSFVRVMIEAEAGDPQSRRILWFARNPAYFVATTLVGNNVANYITTLAIGLAAVVLVGSRADWVEIVATMLMAPVVFVIGEMLPKTLYFRAPLYYLRRGVRLFRVFYWIFLPLSFPLIQVSRLLERLGRGEGRPLEIVLGRRRLEQVLSAGHREGLLSDPQGRLAQGLLEAAAQPVVTSITPLDRILGLPDDASRPQLLDWARRFGLTSVTVRRPDDERGWYGYVRVVDLAITSRPTRSLIQTMPVIDVTARKLEAILTLRDAGAAYGAVVDGARVAGVVSERGLVEQLFRSPQSVEARLPLAVP